MRFNNKGDDCSFFWHAGGMSEPDVVVEIVFPWITHHGGLSWENGKEVSADLRFKLSVVEVGTGVEPRAGAHGLFGDAVYNEVVDEYCFAFSVNLIFYKDIEAGCFFYLVGDFDKLSGWAVILVDDLEEFFRFLEAEKFHRDVKVEGRNIGEEKGLVNFAFSVDQKILQRAVYKVDTGPEGDFASLLV